MEPELEPRGAHQGSHISPRRWLAVVVLPALLILATVAYLLIVQGRLPIEVATHWGADGQADGFTNRSNLPWVVGGLALALSLPLMAIALIPQASVMMPRALNGLTLGFVTFMVSLFLLTTADQLDTGGAVDGAVSQLPIRIIPIAIALALAAGGLGALVGGPPPAPPTTSAPAPAGATRIPLTAGQTAVWAGRTPFGRAIIVALIVAGLINVVCAVVLGAWWLVLFLAFVSLIVIANTSFTVTAGPTGVRATGILGFPRIHIPLDQITAANAGTVNAASYGGWGLRIRPKGDSAVLTRSGPALVVHRTDGARLNISLDHPERPAAVLSALLDRRATESTAGGTGSTA